MSMINQETLRPELPLLAQFYWQMAVIRAVEQTLLQLFQENRLSGTTHTSIGQEANAVALMNAIDRDRDTVWSNHRCHGHFIAYCGQVVPLLAEILGRTGGVCAGRGGSQHLSFGHFHSSGIQGGLAPLGVGTALAGREQGAISIVMLGDGTMGEGVIYEGMNLASLWDLPVLFVVEDNGIAQTTPKAMGVSGSIRERAAPFGIRTFGAAETDPMRLHDLASEVVDYVRHEQKPAWLHLESIRLGPHSKGDDTRSLDELQALRARDPLRVAAAQLPEADRLLADAHDFVLEALQQAEGMPVACG